MLRNILKLAFRSIWKNKTFSLINIIGLSIGLSASFVIGIMIFYELSFDKFHSNGELVYRVTSDFVAPEGEFHNRGVPVPLGKEVREGLSGIEMATTFFNTYFAKVYSDVGDKTFRDIDDAIYTDEAYFELFKYKWLAGDPKGILSDPNEVVLTKSRALKYFPDQSMDQIIGKALRYNDSVIVNIVGVVENFKERSDFNFQEFLSYQTASSSRMKDQILVGNWNGTNSASQVFIRLENNLSLGYVQKRLDQLAVENADKELLELGQKRTFHLQPLSDIHFNPKYGIFNNNNKQASKSALISLALVALFLLLLGCINFINLNTAQSTKRAKEIGIRKTLGSSKKQLIYQFMGETFLLTLVAAMISLVFSSWLLRIFSDFIPQGIALELFANPMIILSAIVLLLVVMLLSGFYPALVLANFRPISVLKNQLFHGETKSTLRKYLTVFQFVIAQIFIIATLMVGKQLNYVMSMDMGFKTQANAFVRTWHDNDFGKRLNFVEAIKSIPQVTGISLGGDPPASGNTNSTMARYHNGANEINTSVQLLMGDLNYRKIYGINLLAGRERLNDTISEYVINETYSRVLGFENPVDAIGQYVKVNDELVPIVGVMEDFYQRSLHSNIQPMALIGDLDRRFYHQFNTVHFSLDRDSSENWPETLVKVEDEWKSIYPQTDFEINFMDDTIKQFYEQERRTSVLLKWAMGLAIAISCLGLLGLVIYTTERRTKEIGIRKVLGATLGQLNVLLCKEFLFLVGIAFVIATPITWYGIDQWLNDFAFKTNMSWWIFVLGGISMLLIASIIVGLRSIAAANANPIESLQVE